MFDEVNLLPNLESQIPNVLDIVDIPLTNVPSIRDKLQQCVLESNTSKNNVNKLLKILRSEGLNLPLDVRTLMNTPRSHTIIEISPGPYIHLGLKKCCYLFFVFMKIWW